MDQNIGTKLIPYYVGKRFFFPLEIFCQPSSIFLETTIS